MCSSFSPEGPAPSRREPSLHLFRLRKMTRGETEGVSCCQARPYMSGASGQVSDPGSHPITSQKLFLTPHSLSGVHSKLAQLPKWGQSERWLLRTLATLPSSWLALGPCGSQSSSQGSGLPLGPRVNGLRVREPVLFGERCLFGPSETGPRVCRAVCALTWHMSPRQDLPGQRPPRTPGLSCQARWDCPGQSAGCSLMTAAGVSVRRVNRQFVY